MTKIKGDVMDLDTLARNVLFTLPTEPNGLSLDELAEGVLDDRSPFSRGLVAGALAQIREQLGIFERRGDDDLGHADVTLYGLTRWGACRAQALAALQKRWA